MTDLRTAAQQALEAEPAQGPVAWSGYDLDGMVEAFSRVIEAHHSSKHPFHNPIDMDARMALRILRGFISAMKAYAALAQQAEPLEPVAWRWGYRSVTTGEMDWRGYVEIAAHPNLRSPEIIMEPLYTAPPQRKPLPKHDQHCVDVPGYGLMAVRLVRAVERAHGITDPQVADRLARHGIPMPGDPK